MKVEKALHRRAQRAQRGKAATMESRRAAGRAERKKKKKSSSLRALRLCARIQRPGIVVKKRKLFRIAVQRRKPLLPLSICERNANNWFSCPPVQPQLVGVTKRVDTTHVPAGTAPIRLQSDLGPALIRPQSEFDPSLFRVQSGLDPALFRANPA